MDCFEYYKTSRASARLTRDLWQQFYAAEMAAADRIRIAEAAGIPRVFGTFNPQALKAFVNETTPGPIWTISYSHNWTKDFSGLARSLVTELMPNMPQPLLESLFHSWLSYVARHYQALARKSTEVYAFFDTRLVDADHLRTPEMHADDKEGRLIPSLRLTLRTSCSTRIQNGHDILQPAPGEGFEMTGDTLHVSNCPVEPTASKFVQLVIRPAQFAL